MNARAYFRVSRQGQTLDQQRQIVRDYCSSRGWPIVREYEEQESTRKARPIREKLLRETRHGEVLVAVRMDRIGRSVKELTELAETCRVRGVDLVFVTQQIDTTSPAGRFFYTVLAAVAEFERDLISSRTKEKLALVRVRLRAEGRDLGRPRRPVDLAKLRELRAEGFGLRTCADRLGVSTATVRKRLSEMLVEGNGAERG